MNEEIKPGNVRIHSRADELIACLEGEIAKRDAELAACRVAVENCELFRARIAELEARIVWLECEAKVNAAPVSEAKAQGVVLDGSQLAGLLEQVRLDDDEAKPHGSGATYWNNAVIACQVAIRDALAAPVQQVSVPDGSTKMQWPEIVALVNEVLGCEAHKYPCERGSIGHEMTGINFNSLARIINRVRYAAALSAGKDSD